MKIEINKIYRGAIMGFAAFAVSAITSCSGLLDAENPNSLVLEDLSNPAAAGPMVNGSLSAVTRALTNIYAPYSTASDELTWSGSRDAWNQLQLGFVGFDGNEFTDAASFFVGEARWWGDEVISRLEQFDQDGELANPAQLANAYLYAAIMYVTLGDMFDDYIVDSDQRVQGTPVGEANMSQMYNIAIGYLTSGLAIAEISDDQRITLTAMLARAQHGLGVWGKVNPVNTADPYVNNAAAITAAQNALALMGEGSNWRYQLLLDGSLPGINASTDGNGLAMPQEVNQRREMQVSESYVIQNGNTIAGLVDGLVTDIEASIFLEDPVTGEKDVTLFNAVAEFHNAVQFADITIVSEREMHLILAEAALAGGTTGGTFADHINAVRSLDGKTAFAGQISDKDMLNHARRVHLFLQGRRLADHYRFGPDYYAPRWIPNSDAVSSPGTFLPITTVEIQAMGG
ncbi:MAG: hypothetical protein RJQ09_00815 [Cyclobacteriaceae bacterium]